MGHPGLGSHSKDPEGEMPASAEVMAGGWGARKSQAGKQGWQTTTRATGSANEEGGEAFPLEEGQSHPCCSASGTSTAFLSLDSSASSGRKLLSLRVLAHHIGPFLVSKGPSPDFRYSACKRRASHEGLVGRVPLFTLSGVWFWYHVYVSLNEAEEEDTRGQPVVYTHIHTHPT